MVLGASALAERCVGEGGGDVMTRIALIGPGAVGGTIAAWLAQTHDVIVCARTPLDHLEIETPQGVIRAAPRIITDPEQASPGDWVLIATKTYDAESAARWLPALMDASTRVAVLQNGVEHVERFAPFVAPARITPAVVDIPAERNAPGRILQRRFGWIVVPEGQDGADFVSLFSKTRIEVSTSPDWKTVAWKKLCLNSAGAVSALTLKGAGVSRREDIAEIMREIVRECVEVGRSVGADLSDNLPDEVVANSRATDPASMNSLVADRIAGRPMEIDARNGVIVRLGARAGIETPMNKLVVSLLEASAT